MAQWKSANLASFIPAGFDSLVDSVASTVGTVSGILGTLKGVLQTSKAFLVSFPVFNFAGLLTTSIQSFKDTFLGSGFYALLLWDYPIKQLYRNGSSGEPFVRSFAQDVAAAFTDTSDPNRPPQQGSCAMIVIVGATPGLPGLTEAIGAARDAFSWWSELNQVYVQTVRLVKQIEANISESLVRSGKVQLTSSKQDWTKTQAGQSLLRARRNLMFMNDADIVAAPSPGTTRSSIEAFITYVEGRIQNSTYPDFQKIALRDVVPPLVNVFDQVFDPLLATLQSGRNAVDAITAMIDVLTAKVDALENVLNRIELYITQLDALIGATGLYALWCEGDGTESITQQLRTATNTPFNGENGFYFGFVLVASGPSLTPFTALFKPIGA